MNEITIKCPYCRTENHFFPPRTVNIGVFNCIKCDKSLHLVFYDEQISPDHQQHNEKEAPE